MSIVVRAQTHKSWYQPGDMVKLQLSVHVSVNKWQSSANNANSSNPQGSSRNVATSSSSSSGFHLMGSSSTVIAASSSSPSSSSSSAAGIAPYNLSKLIPDPLLHASDGGISASSSTIASSSVHLFEIMTQLVGFSCIDHTKLSTGDDTESIGAILPLQELQHRLQDPTRRQLSTSDVVGRNETLSLTWVSNPARPFRDTVLRLGEPKSASVVHLLPSELGLPSYRGQAVRISYMIVVSVEWSSVSSSSSTVASARRTTTIRVPIKVFCADAVCSSIARRSRQMRHPTTLWQRDANFANDGSYVEQPLQPSPAVCPPLHDELVPRTATVILSSRTAGGIRRSASSCVINDAPFLFGDPHHSDWNTNANQSSSSSSSSYTGRVVPCVQQPTDYVIRYKEAHTMNLLIESMNIVIGGYLRGVFVVPTSGGGAATTGGGGHRSGVTVGRITLTIECLEISQKKFLAAGASASDVSVPVEAVPHLTSSTTNSGLQQQHVVCSATTLDEREWYLLDAIQLPFELCISNSKFQQTLRSPLLTTAYIMRWKFWCVESNSATSATLPPAGTGHGQCRRKLMELYQELELPFVVYPPSESANPQMGAAVFGI